MKIDANIQKLTFRVWLQKEFTDRCRRNSQYSLRAFSKLLQMDPSSISQILSGKRIASTRVISKICDSLSIHPHMKMQFLDGIKKRNDKFLDESANYLQISADIFSVIADWYHYAILELSYTKGFKNSNKWIAKKLGITVTEASMAIDRLKRLELIEEVRGKLVKTDMHITNGTDGFTAPGLKELQRQLLKKALEAIDHETSDIKDITSMTMAIDPKLIPDAREKIRKFRRELCGFLESGNRTQVFNLGIQLFPISKSTLT